MNEDQLKRFWDKVIPEPNSGCWLWVGSTDRHGYGHLSVDRKLRYAHRLAYEHYVGPIPEGLSLDHLCRNPFCSNPDHLEPVTHAENVRRGRGGEWGKAKTHCPRGHVHDKRDSRGARICSTCESLRNKKRWAENPEYRARGAARMRARRAVEKAAKA